ncbi:MAG: phoA 4 [Geminicoccaceae bacterium]|nr:phoA 4 [Geminicoccaceae bacterium]
MKPLALITGIVISMGAVPVEAQEIALPRKPGSVRFLVLGDAGTGERQQYEVANQILRFGKRFPFTFAIMLGDNIYGAERPQDFRRKFELPYSALIQSAVEFHVALGNHDDPNQRYYKPFNLGGDRYRTFKKGNVRFFILDSNYLDPAQVKWLEKELESSGSDWKIVYFHHPLYTTARRGPEVELRAILEPLFVKHGVDVVFAGHEHIYERFKPQKGIPHFTVGGAAKLRRGDTSPNPILAARYDRDRSFLLAEIAGDTLFFQAVSRRGGVIDKGFVVRRDVTQPVALAQPARTP